MANKANARNIAPGKTAADIPNFSNELRTSAAVSEKPEKTTSKPLMLTVVILYYIANFILLITILVNIPLLRDTLDLGNFEYVLHFIRQYYLYGAAPAIVVILAGTFIMFSNFLKYRFPSNFSLYAMAYNCVISTVFLVLIYMINLRGIYFSYQVVFVIPIITNFLSSVFLIDDFDDLRKNKFMYSTAKEKKKKHKKGELLPTEMPEQTHMESTPDHESAAAEAAKIAIPTLGVALGAAAALKPTEPPKPVEQPETETETEKETDTDGTE